MPPRAGAELSPGRLAESHGARTEGVPARREPAGVTAGDERAQEAMDRRQRQPRTLRELTQPGIVAELRQDLQQVERPLDRLHTGFCHADLPRPARPAVLSYGGTSLP
nr:hypothetical protein GCM10025730_11040 [Promicromonospora thailandica]